MIDDDDFDENDMMAAIEAEQAEKAAAGGDDEEFDENDMMAAIEAEQAERGADGGDDGDEFDENDMMAAIAAEQAERAGGGDAGGGGGGGDDVRLSLAVSAVENIGVDITAVLGVADMKVSNLLKIGRGAVIELNRRVGDAVELRVAGRPIAKGDVVVVEDHLAVSVTEVFKRSTVPQD
ncbi:FliM/FliN family flagellar motor switch protein [Aestuariispira insulae]|uniref:Flagellar motor switch protein FliN n=1 Tax=Aestuariispira insulae TaxID=1461337 RepID=A0A3D9HY91_9PROT|nr:FliM/FliN family flagellar motor switch protein [Aestuariispira insulae]RED53876.1 flagellar motor switch protein FliN [Aestuariispira insulae]